MISLLLFLVSFFIAPLCFVESYAQVDEELADTYVINKIEATLYTPTGAVIITKMQIDRPNLMGEEESVDTIIFRKLVVADSAELKIPRDDDALDKYIATLPVKPEELKATFEAAGRTMEEGREELRDLQTMNMMFEVRILSNLFVSKKAIQQYYDAHPEWEDTSYQLLRALIAYRTDISHEDQLHELEKACADGNEKDIAWGAPFWINEHDLDPAKGHIMDMEPGSMSPFYETPAGFEVYKLVAVKEKKLKSLESRLFEITNALKRPLYMQLLDDYKKQLFNKASIVYFP